MTWPVVDVAFWRPGSPASAALDRLVADDSLPLARLGVIDVAAAYAAHHGATLGETQRQWHDHVATKSLAVDGALTEVVPALKENDVRFFVAKGPAAAHLYPGPQLRSYTDLDVYVPSGELEHARRTLAHVGYAPVPQRIGALGGLPRELHGGTYGAVVEVHADLVDNMQRRWLPPIEDYLPFIEERSILGIDVPVLTRDAHLCLEAIHLGAGHRYARLGCYRDIDLLADATDDDLANQLGALPYLRVALDVLRAWGRDTPVVAGGGRAHRWLVAALASDPLGWNEFRPNPTNALALANQARWQSSVRATLAAGRALLPDRGRRASISMR